MSEPINIQRSYEAVEIKLGARLYETVKMTRSVLKKIEALEGEAEKADESGDVDEQVAALAKVLDAQLLSANGSTAKPSTQIMKLWKGDDIGVDDIFRILEQIAEAGRPT